MSYSLSFFNGSLEKRVPGTQVLRLLAKFIKFFRHSTSHTQNGLHGRYFSGNWICGPTGSLSLSTNFILYSRCSVVPESFAAVLDSDFTFKSIDFVADTLRFQDVFFEDRQKCNEQLGQLAETAIGVNPLMKCVYIISSSSF